MRAQWAARPFVWQIYPTEDGAHYVKMAAFLARYTDGLDRAQAAAVAGLWEAWNRPPGGQHEGAATPGLAEAWAAFIAREPALTEHARRWARRLEAQNELADAACRFRRQRSTITGFAGAIFPNKSGFSVDL